MLHTRKKAKILQHIMTARQENTASDTNVGKAIDTVHEDRIIRACPSSCGYTDPNPGQIILVRRCNQTASQQYILSGHTAQSGPLK